KTFTVHIKAHFLRLIVEDGGEMNPLPEAFRRKDDWADVVVGDLGLGTGHDSQTDRAVVENLPVDSTRLDALAHAQRTLALARAQAVELHPGGERELTVFAGDIEPHAVAHAAKLE